MHDHKLPRGARSVLSAVVGAFALAAVALASAVLAGVFKVSAVLSGSMAPAFRPGDALVVAPTSGQALRVGEVVMFRAPLPGHPLVAHRIVSLAAGFFKTKGDANTGADLWSIPRSHVQLWHLVTVVPRLGYLISGLHSTIVLALLVVIVAMALAALTGRWLLFGGRAAHHRVRPALSGLAVIASIAVVGSTSAGTLALLSSTVSSQYLATSGTIDMNITGDLAGTAVIPATNIADGDTIERAVTISNTGTGAWSRVRFKTSDSSTLSANEVIDPNFSYVNSGGSWALGGGHMSVSGANMVYSGTGVPANGQDEAMSQPMTFPVGTQLVVSYNYNDSQATSGSVQACLYSAATGCHGDLEAAGTNGSASFYWTVGATDGPLQFALYPYLINVPVGKTVTFSGPSIQVIGTPTVDSATNGFQLQIDRCSIPWNNGGTLGNPYNCTGTQTAVLAATPVIVTTPVSLPGLSSLAPGSTDYLRVRIFLPSASNVNNLEDQAPVYNLTFQAVQRIASTTNS